MLKSGLQSKTAKMKERISAARCSCNRGVSLRSKSAQLAQCSCGRQAQLDDYYHAAPRHHSDVQPHPTSSYPPLQIFVLGGIPTASSLHDLARLCQPAAQLLTGAPSPDAAAAPNRRANVKLAPNDLRHTRRPTKEASPPPCAAPATAATSPPPTKSKASKRHARHYMNQLNHERAMRRTDALNAQLVSIIESQSKLAEDARRTAPNFITAPPHGSTTTSPGAASCAPPPPYAAPLTAAASRLGARRELALSSVLARLVA